MCRRCLARFNLLSSEDITGAGQRAFPDCGQTRCGRRPARQLRKPHSRFLLVNLDDAYAYCSDPQMSWRSLAGCRRDFDEFMYVLSFDSRPSQIRRATKFSNGSFIMQDVQSVPCAAKLLPAFDVSRWSKSASASPTHRRSLV